MTLYRAIATDAPDSALDGRWWADDEDACRAVCTTLYGGYAEDCRVTTRVVDVTDFAEYELDGELYEPDHEAEWMAAIDAGAAGVVVHDCQMTEGFEPCTVVLLGASR